MTLVNGFSGEPLGQTLSGLNALFAYTSTDFAGGGPDGAGSLSGCCVTLYPYATAAMPSTAMMVRLV